PVPDSENVTGIAPLLVFKATTVTAPLVFLKAFRVSLPSVVVAPIRTAPGSTKRLKFPNAHSRPVRDSEEPLISRRPSLSPLADGVVDPHQYRNALRLDWSSPAKMFCAQVRPEALLWSSHAVSKRSKVDHSVCQAGLLQPESGVVGGKV